jgi:hypothetical protein
LKIAIVKQKNSPEATFIESVLASQDLSVFNQYETSAYCESYDLVIGIGPVKMRPVAKRAVLFALGETRFHHNLEWDLVVVTCKKAVANVLKIMGHKCKLVIAPPALTDLHVGRRRIVDDNRYGLYAGSWITIGLDSLYSFGIYQMNLWDDYVAADAVVPGVRVKNMDYVNKIDVYSSLEFNSLVRGGAVGIYPAWMDDGYDIQVRRHLALGGSVMCSRDKDVIGDLADIVYDIKDIVDFEKVERRDGNFGDINEIDNYAEKIREIVGL